MNTEPPEDIAKWVAWKDQEDGEEEEDLDVELTLLALTEDAGGPTEDVDLKNLSPAERQALLSYLREHLGLPRRGGL